MMAVAQGVQDSLIRKMGQWQGVAFELYIQMFRELLAVVSSTMAKRNIYCYGMHMAMLAW